MKPGTTVEYDYRKTKTTTKTTHLKVCQWNIQRGYKINEIIQLLRHADADILSLQELDVGCARTDYLNIPQILAKELELKCIYVVEFEELHSQIRSSYNQGGGTHGNAILSKFDFHVQVIHHSYNPVNWERDGILYHEPRIGQ